MLSLFQKLSITKQCFPDSWYRKLLYLFYPSLTIKSDGKIVAYISHNNREILILGVDKEHRRKGLASQLVQKCPATTVQTYKSNGAAIKFYKKNGFALKEEKKTPFGVKVKLVRK